MIDSSAKDNRKTGSVLGVSLDLHDYASAWKQIADWTESDSPKLVAAANTHLVGEAATDASFASTLADFDMVLPDGMPLVWALQLDGWSIQDRVYGPYLMRYILTHSTVGMKHFFFGGTEECLKLLSEQARKMNPGINICGTLSPPFRAWDEDTESQLINEINQADADFIWVALGGVKQETWLHRNRGRFKRGVFLAVGDAFVLNAGMRSYAPQWMQRMGLTWLYRLIQEPARLSSRYLRYNSRFAFAYLRERILKVWR